MRFEKLKCKECQREYPAKALYVCPFCCIIQQKSPFTTQDYPKIKLKTYKISQVSGIVAFLKEKEEESDGEFTGKYFPESKTGSISFN